jgi:lincosamide nucleotidyltransferase A/C/D/E
MKVLVRQTPVVQAADVLEVLDCLATAGVPVWLDGGWGVDALLGRQTRPHDDADVVLALEQTERAIAALAGLGFAVSQDLRPTRLVLRGGTGRQIDVHPVVFDRAGDGWQHRASPDGSDCRYPADGFVTGTVAGRAVGCLSAAVQVAHHTGYPPQEKDMQDMGRLCERFGLTLPPELRPEAPDAP